MSQVLAFYRGEAADTEGRRLSDILAWDDEEFEIVHDFVQWLFPLPEPSRFNPDAPLLTAEDIAAFRTDPVMRANLLRSFRRFLTFLGLAQSADGTVSEGPNFAARVADVWAYPNHNWLRITRLLRSLRVLGMEEQARHLHAWLEAQYRTAKFPIPPDTFRYWTEAVEGTPFHA
jgi:hypothetical protein